MMCKHEHGRTDLNPVADDQPRAAHEWSAVHVGSVRAAQIFDERPVRSHRQPGVSAGDIGRAESHACGSPPDDDLGSVHAKGPTEIAASHADEARGRHHRPRVVIAVRGDRNAVYVRSAFVGGGALETADPSITVWPHEDRSRPSAARFEVRSGSDGVLQIVL